MSKLSREPRILFAGVLDWDSFASLSFHFPLYYNGKAWCLGVALTMRDNCHRTQECLRWCVRQRPSKSSNDISNCKD